MVASIGSSLDVNAIVSSLVTAESTRKQGFLIKQAGVKTSISEFGKLLAGLDKLAGMVPPSAFTVSKTADIGTASAQAASDYEITVQRLASQHKIYSTGFASKTEPLSSGTLTLDLGAVDAETFVPEKTLTIQLTGKTLQEVQSTINASSLGIKANLLQTDSGYRLALTGTNSKTIRMQGTEAGANLTFDPLSETNPMFKAGLPSLGEITVDGVLLKSSSNSYALDGLTFTAKAVGTAQIVATEDNSATTEYLQGFAKNMTEVLSSLKAQYAKNPDANLLSVQLSLADKLRSVAGKYGLATQRDGTITFDESKYTGEPIAALANLFSINKTTLTTRVTTLENKSAALTKQIDAEDRRLEQMRTRLNRTYGVLNDNLTKMNSILSMFA